MAAVSVPKRQIIHFILGANIDIKNIVYDRCLGKSEEIMFF
jgi:hypothetical protein